MMKPCYWLIFIFVFTSPVYAQDLPFNSEDESAVSVADYPFDDAEEAKLKERTVTVTPVSKAETPAKTERPVRVIPVKRFSLEDSLEDIAKDLTDSSLLPLEEDLTSSSELTEAEEEIVFPMDLNPVPGLRVRRYENSEMLIEPKSGHVVFKGDCEAWIGNFFLLDNNQGRFRLVMDAEEKPTRLQLQGLVPAIGKLSTEIAGEIDPLSEVYHGQLIIDFSRLGLYEYMNNRDLITFEFTYHYMKEDFIQLDGPMPELKVSRFTFEPRNLVLRQNGLYFDFTLEDDLDHLEIYVYDYRLSHGGPKTEKMRGSINFLGNLIQGVDYNFRDRFVKLTFPSDFIFGIENQFILEYFPDGKIRFLSTLKTPNGEEVVFTSPLVFKEDAYYGKGEIVHQDTKRFYGHAFCEEMRLDLEGALSGSCRVDKGTLDGKLFEKPAFQFEVDPFGKFTFSEAAEPEPLPEPITETVSGDSDLLTPSTVHFTKEVSLEPQVEDGEEANEMTEDTDPEINSSENSLVG